MSNYTVKVETMPRIVVFLDMDGVLNNKRFFNESGVAKNGLYPPGNAPQMTVDNAAVMMLKSWVEENNGFIVVSSSWRSNTMNAGEWKNEKSNNFQVWNALRWAGWSDVESRLIGNTGRLWGKKRGAEVDDWIQKNGCIIDKECCFVILDDLADFNVKQKKSFLVKTDSETGLSRDDISRMDDCIRGQRETLASEATGISEVEGLKNSTPIKKMRGGCGN